MLGYFSYLSMVLQIGHRMKEVNKIYLLQPGGNMADGLVEIDSDETAIQASTDLLTFGEVEIFVDHQVTDAGKSRTSRNLEVPDGNFVDYVDNEEDVKVNNQSDANRKGEQGVENPLDVVDNLGIGDENTVVEDLDEDDDLIYDIQGESDLDDDELTTAQKLLAKHREEERSFLAALEDVGPSAGPSKVDHVEALSQEKQGSGPTDEGQRVVQSDEQQSAGPIQPQQAGSSQPQRSAGPNEVYTGIDGDEIDDISSSDPGSYIETSEGSAADDSRRTRSRQRLYSSTGACKDFFVGQIFRDSTHFKDFLEDYGIQHQFLFLYKKNEKLRVRAKCAGKGCPWEILASRHGEDNSFRVKTLISQHSCLPTSGNRRLTAEKIADKFQDEISRMLHVIKAKYIVTFVKEILGITIDEWKARRAKGLVIKKIQGSFVDQFANLRGYGNELMVTNPSSTISIEVDRVTSDSAPTFKRIYVF